jgi:hypothetical protein
MPILYDMPLYRPPSEGNNLIIQATLGCSANYCTFCAMYKTKSYTARPLDQVFADGDAFALHPDQAKISACRAKGNVALIEHKCR